MDLKDLKFGIIQPLIGGMGLAGENCFKKPPEWIISTIPKQNDKHYMEWVKKKYEYPTQNIINSVMTPDEEEKKRIEKFIEDKKVDVILAVPVCGGLSSLNSSDSRGYDAPQNQNMIELTKLSLEYLKPKAYLFENAPSLWGSEKNKPLRDYLIQIGKDAGYSVSLFKTNTNLHGIPQKRSRTYLVYTKSEFVPLFTFEKKVSKNLKEYLKEIPVNATQQNLIFNGELKNSWWYQVCKKLNWNIREEGYRNTRLLFQHKNRETSEKNYEKVLNVIEKNEINLTEKLQQSALKKMKRVKRKTQVELNYYEIADAIYTSDDFINAIQGANFFMIHPEEERYYNVREFLHLMGHPHDFELQNLKDIGNNNVDDVLKFQNMIAQNVPVPTTEYIINNVIDWLTGKIDYTNANIGYFDNLKQKVKLEIITENLNKCF